MSNNEIIRQEIELIIKDITELYNNSNKRVAGSFLEGLEAKYKDNKVTLFGFTYLDGRKSGKQPPIQNIEQWIIDKGIKPIEDNISISSLAFLIARSIGRNGTKEENHLKIYQEIITPQRIDSIIEKVSQFNVNHFIEQLELSFDILEKNK